MRPFKPWINFYNFELFPKKKLNLDQKYVFYSRTLTENRDKIVLQLSSRLFVWKQQKKLSTNCREQWLQFGCKIEYLHSFAYTNYRHNFRRVKYVNVKYVLVQFNCWPPIFPVKVYIVFAYKCNRHYTIAYNIQLECFTKRKIITLTVMKVVFHAVFCLLMKPLKDSSKKIWLVHLKSN